MVLEEFHKLVALYGDNEAQTIVNGLIDVLLTLEDPKLGEEFSKKAGEFEEIYKTYNSSNNGHTTSKKNLEEYAGLLKSYSKI